MNIEEVQGTIPPWPRANGSVAAAETARPSDDDPSTEASIPAWLITLPPEPIWPRVFPGL